MNTASFDPVQLLLITNMRFTALSILMMVMRQEMKDLNKKARQNSATGLSRSLSFFGKDQNGASY